MTLIKTFILSGILILLFMGSCKKDRFIVDSAASLAYSTDTVFFDTVFTSIGSTTKIFKIYNHHNQKINVSRIYLATGNQSQFRINVDGVSAPLITDVEILGNDSLFVFVQVTVDPTGINAPLLIKDSIIFEYNGNVQDVKLTAVGQDVYLHKPNKFSTNGLPPYSLIDCSVPWTNDKPHLILGYAVVDSDSILTMNPGTRVYINTGGVLWVFVGGSLQIKGVKDNEVTFQGARLEEGYQEIPGQWGKIWMMAGSKNNSIDWAILKNGSIGIQTDSMGVAGSPLLKISNSIIKNMSSAAIYSKRSHIWSGNCVFSNCGQYVAALTVGGRYRFEHCTFANYWTRSIRNTPLLLVNNYLVEDNVTKIVNLDTAYFGNCILYGLNTDEIELDPAPQAGNFSYEFRNCVLKTNLNTSDISYYQNIYKNTSPSFENSAENNFQLTDGSIAIDKGYASPILMDLKGENRPNPNTSLPDIGTYEYY